MEKQQIDRIRKRLEILYAVEMLEFHGQEWFLQNRFDRTKEKLKIIREVLNELPLNIQTTI